MQKKLVTIVAALLLSGCAGATVYVQQHAAGIAAFSLVAGAVATGENAIANAWTLFDKAKAETKEKQ